MRPTMEHKGSRRGSAYIVVLGAAMIVSVIGLTSLLAARVAGRQTDGAELTAVRLMGPTLIDLVQYRLSIDPAWRTRYTSGVWTSMELLDNLEFSFRLTDEMDNNLADDVYDPVRLEIQATINETTRLYRLGLQSRFTTGPPPNLIDNADMEDGVLYYTCVALCDLQESILYKVSGSFSIHVKNRNFDYTGAMQEVGSKLVDGVTYNCEAWIRLKDVASWVRFAFHYQDDLGAGWLYSNTSTWVVPNTWVLVNSPIDVNFVGVLDFARFRVCTPGTVTEFWLDDYVLDTGSQPAASMIPVPGTYERTVLP